ncbi:MAG: thermonuclease family protein [Candidatus Woesebacteria bacterium]|nr:thermonuclease family protein [Candidatus Woesebacteria bacterium]
MIKFRKIIFFASVGIILILIGIFIISNKKEVVQVVYSPIPSTSSISTPGKQVTYAEVTRVIDGDTIVIDTGWHVRYIGMNTPEMETNECFATEASEMNKNLVLGKTVKMERDVSETDKYGRLLRYVYIGDIFVDDELVKEGFAKIETVPPDERYKNQFLESEKYAKENSLGLWSKCF